MGREGKDKHDSGKDGTDLIKEPSKEPTRHLQEPAVSGELRGNERQADLVAYNMLRAHQEDEDRDGAERLDHFFKQTKKQKLRQSSGKDGTDLIKEPSKEPTRHLQEPAVSGELLGNERHGFKNRSKNNGNGNQPVAAISETKAWRNILGGLVEAMLRSALKKDSALTTRSGVPFGYKHNFTLE
eukprot:g3607.t1